MSQRPALPALFSSRFLPLATVALAVAIFTADALTPPDCVVSGLYVLVVLMAGRFTQGRKLWVVCLGCVGLAVLSQVLAHQLVSSSTQLFYIGSANLAVGIVTIVMSGYLVQRGQASQAALRRAQADLAHVSRVTTMGELTASIAHEINQPIAGVVTNASACLRWLAGAGNALEVEEARAAATRIVRDGTRAAEIISRIRQIFVKGGAERQSTDINQLVRDTIDLLASEFGRHRISLRTDLALGLAPLWVDPVQVQQVLVNLIANSVDAMKNQPGARELTIKSWSLDRGGATISVSDNGQGLPAGDTERLFDAFVTTKAQGTGMGLSISRSIIEAHDGELAAVNNLPKGATFHFTLPVGAPDTAP